MNSDATASRTESDTIECATWGCESKSFKLASYTCRCTKGRHICEKCVEQAVLANGGLKCAQCREPILQLTQITDVAELVSRVLARGKNLNAGVDEEDFRFRWEVDYLAGIRGTCMGDLQFKVIWKKTSSMRRVPKATWEPAVNLQTGGSSMLIEQFLARHGFPLLDPEIFKFPVDFEIQKAKRCSVKSAKTGRSNVLYKCSASGCKYTSRKLSNMQSHEKSRHPVAGRKLKEFKCAICFRTFGLRANYMRHGRNFHGVSKE